MVNPVANGMFTSPHQMRSFVMASLTINRSFGERPVNSPDYFEIYFPFYSNLGWEIDQAQYSQKIRFVFTAEPKALLGLFRREWF